MSVLILNYDPGIEEIGGWNIFDLRPYDCVTILLWHRRNIKTAIKVKKIKLQTIDNTIIDALFDPIPPHYDSIGQKKLLR